MSPSFFGNLHFFSQTGTEGGHWAFQWNRFIEDLPGGPHWSYDGLHILGDGDRLRVFESEDSSHVLWEGEIALQPHPVFTETASGLWIRSDQAGCSRSEWAAMFFSQRSAELIPARIPRRWTEVIASDLGGLSLRRGYDAEVLGR